MIIAIIGKWLKNGIITTGFSQPRISLGME
jgi:hypothetical protein